MQMSSGGHHAPYPGVMNLNSPKYATSGGQPSNLLGQAMSSGIPNQHYQYPGGNDGRQGPIVISNNRPTI